MNTIKVYKTTVDNQDIALRIVDEIRSRLPKSDPSFDLEDCDNVLRVACDAGVKESLIQYIIHNYGYQLEVLP